MRIGRFPSRHDAARPSALVYGGHFDGIQVIGGEPVLATEEAKRTTQHVTAHANLRILAER